MWGLVYRYAVLTGRDRQLHSKLGLTIMALLQVSYTAPSLVVHILSARNTEGIRSVVLKVSRGSTRALAAFLNDGIVASFFVTRLHETYLSFD